LCSRGERVLDDLGFVSGVVGIGALGCLEDRGEQRARVAQSLANSSRYGNQAVVVEVILYIFPRRRR